METVTVTRLGMGMGSKIRMTPPRRGCSEGYRTAYGNDLLNDGASYPLPPRRRHSWARPRTAPPLDRLRSLTMATTMGIVIAIMWCN